MKTQKQSEPSLGESMSIAYLTAYNGSQFFGWSVLTYKLIFYLVTTGGEFSGLYADVAPLLNLIQTAAVLEVFNAATGIVRANLVLTGFQVMSRVFITWHVHAVPEVHDTWAPSLFLMAWGVTEVIRYLFYVLNLFGEPPKLLLWCRYTFFFVLYPLGVTGELASVWLGLGYVKKTQLFSIALPNTLNFAFNYYYVLFFIMATYVPVFPQLYFHMIAQRKKVLGGGKSKTQ